MGNWHLAVVVWTVLISAMMLGQAAWADAIGQIKTLAGDVSIIRDTVQSPAQAGEFLTKMERGTLAVISGHIAHSAQDAMQVQTRTTILGVRGTHFLVQVQ